MTPLQHVYLQQAAGKVSRRNAVSGYVRRRMKEISVGVRIVEEGLEFFGTDEINDLLKRGYQVASIEPGEAMVEAESEESSEPAETGEPVYTLAGFSVTVALKNPTKGGGRTS
jgi:hypothetical protein